MVAGIVAVAIVLCPLRGCPGLTFASLGFVPDGIAGTRYRAVLDAAN